jgi:hypothetical protein
VPIIFTRISGPFILTPIVICAALMQLAAMRHVAERLWIPLLWSALVVLTPFVLEWTGVLNETYTIAGGIVASRSTVFDMRAGIDEAVLVVANFVFITSAGMVAVFISRRRLDAQRQLQVQAWHLHQLLPTAKRWQTQPRSNHPFAQ